MSGFDASWLALREPADFAARHQGLVAQLAELLVHKSSTPTILDLGCGTGSTYRALNSSFPADTRWIMTDYDQDLLDEADRLIASDRVEFHKADLRELDLLALAHPHLVTASAFFDLASASFCEDLLARIGASQQLFYSALNYDGEIRFGVQHPLDADVVRDFNSHQRRDKGFGPALGPQATAHLQGALQALGYHTVSQSSPWVLGEKEADLHAALLEGMVDPVIEVANLNRQQVRDWLEFRLSHVHQADACMVGHCDLLGWTE